MKRSTIIWGYLVGFCLHAFSVKAQINDSLYTLFSEWYTRDTSIENRVWPMNEIMQPHKLTISGFHVDRPIIKLGDGLLSIQYSHQSFVDTPFLGGSLSNRQFMYQQQVKLLNFFPVGINVWGRSMNSPYFRDILDLQLIYDRHQFSQQYKESLLKSYSDALEKKYTGQIEEQLRNVNEKLSKLNSISSKQNIYQWKLQLRELINVKEKSYDLSLPDSINNKRYDSLQAKANALLMLIERFEKKMDQYEKKGDSLRTKLLLARTSINKLKSKAQQLSLYELSQELTVDKYGNRIQKDGSYAKWLKLLSGIQSFKLGRAPLDGGELVSRNMSLNGFQFTYNTWYIFSASIGNLDYRFRDVGLNPKTRIHAPFWSAKLGVGKLSENYVAVSYFSGNKILGSQFNSGASTRIAGAVLEGQVKFSKYGFFKGELAQSSSPDFRPQNVPGQTKLGSFKDANLATAFRINLHFPKTGTRLDGLYRKAGSNFQSFSTWQVNTEQEQWYVKCEQSVWKNRLKFSGALRKQDFSNPFFTQNFQSNTVFKTFTASLRIPRWPSLLVGYIPISQYALVGEQVVEARFQTITAQAFHFYRIGKIMTSTQLLFNQNINSTQSAFVYNNVRSLLFNQTFLFKVFTSQFSVSDTRNAIYNLMVLDNRVNFPLFKNCLQIGAGVKLGRYNNQIYKVGGSGNLLVQLRKGDQFQLQWDKSFLPTEQNGLRYNDMASIIFIKAIDFSPKAKRSKSGL